MSRIGFALNGDLLCSSDNKQQLGEFVREPVLRKEHNDTDQEIYSTEIYDGIPKCSSSSPKLISHLNCNIENDDSMEECVYKGISPQVTPMFHQRFSTTRTGRLDSPLKASLHMDRDKSVFTFQEKPGTTLSFGGDKFIRQRLVAQPSFKAVSQRPVPKCLYDDTLEMC